MKSEAFLVYGLHDGDGVIRYVGRRKIGYDRLRMHISHAASKNRTPSQRWIITVLQNGGSIHECILHEGLDVHQSFDLERQEISNRGRLSNGSGILLNVTSGGQGTLGRKHTDESRKNMSIAMMGNTNGRHTKGLLEGRPRPGGDRVVSWAMDGTAVACFMSFSDAARHYGVGQAAISKCVRSEPSSKLRQGGCVNTKFGYMQFSRIHDTKHPIRVVCVEQEGHKSRYFLNVADASKILGVPKCRISSSIHDKCRFTKNGDPMSATWVICDTYIMEKMENDR